MSTTNPPKALLTDVFGTVVDWRSSVTNGARTAAAQISWAAVAQLWRTSYYHFTRTYDPAAAQKDPSKFKTVDQHHVEALHQILVDHGLEGLWTDEEVQKISMIWHFLDPWPDSNGNTALLRDLATHGHLPYKHILSGEDFGAYKPHPSVYLGAAQKLGLEPAECALVAAHLGDLKAARGCGYQTIYIERPQEEGWSKEDTEQAKQQGWVDMWIGLDEGEGGFLEIARRFGVQ
ncbi:hypothetical protein CLAIMM_15094 [Cladophialophora immunda]|nr:hypothetical protein CLAIMM_15094 [Cladophialophora immunda]